jgi:serine/threonine-protein kinase
LAPEAITSPDAVGPATDLYAVGAVAYRLLTGHPPFEGQTIVEVCSKHLLAEPAPLSSHSGIRVPAELDRLILACLAKSPAARPASAAELRERLEAVPLTTTWNARDAEHWWTTRSSSIVASAKHERRQSRSASPVTIAIDLAARSRIQPAS